jgi:nucleoside-diphosphate-sugar epimerase
VDARDLGDFVVAVTERGVGGTWHTAAAPITFEAMLDDVARAVGGPDLQIVWVEPKSVEEGFERFPLWSGPRSEPVLALDASAAVEAGLRCRSLAESAADTGRWRADQAIA